MEVVSLWRGEGYFMMKVFSELLILLLAFLWVDYGDAL
jgi:hypothetical protein